MNAHPQAVPLVAADRCDAANCNARALVRATIGGDGTLLFCGHHYTCHADRLAAYTIEDFRDKVLVPA